MENGEIVHFEQFHRIPQCFPKGFFFNVLKWVCMKERVNNNISEYENYLEEDDL